MASSSSEVKKGDGTMDVGDVPVALAERLGTEATGGLVRLFNAARESLDDVRGEWSEQVLSLAVERFERRLVEETSKLRVEMAQGFSGLRQEMSSLEGRLRQEMGGLRQEMGGLEGRLRQEMGGLEGRLHKEIGGQRVESLRWSFLFWVGQVAAMAALLGFMLRGVPR
jgi:hypothetical protein